MESSSSKRQALHKGRMNLSRTYEIVMSNMHGLIRCEKADILQTRYFAGKIFAGKVFGRQRIFQVFHRCDQI